MLEQSINKMKKCGLTLYCAIAVFLLFIAALSTSVQAKQALSYPKVVSLNYYESFHGIPMMFPAYLSVTTQQGEAVKVKNVKSDNKNIVCATRITNAYVGKKQNNMILLSQRGIGKTKVHFTVDGHKYSTTVIVKPYPELIKKMVVDGQNFTKMFAKTKNGRCQNKISLSLNNYIAMVVSDNSIPKKTELNVKLQLKKGAKLKKVTYRKTYGLMSKQRFYGIAQEIEQIEGGVQNLPKSDWKNIAQGVNLPYDESGCDYVFYVWYKGAMYQYEIEYADSRFRPVYANQ